jgi:cytochrome P450
VVGRILASRRAGGDGDRRDLLSMLLRARDDEADGAGMTEAQLLDEIRVLLIAGHETTAAALAWTWHLLAAHPVAEARLHAELDEVLGDGPPTSADLPRLPYAEKVITESMRVFPPVYIIGREAVADVEIGGHRVSAGTTVYIPQWVTHRDPRHFDRPEAFDPDRWSDGLAERLPRGAYLPFAMSEAVLVLAALARRFRFEALPGHPVVPWAGLTLRPKHGIKMRVVARRRAAVVRTGPVLRPAPEGAGLPGLSSSAEVGTRRTRPAGAV